MPAATASKPECGAGFPWTPGDLAPLRSNLRNRIEIDCVIAPDAEWQIARSVGVPSTDRAEVRVYKPAKQSNPTIKLARRSLRLRNESWG